MTGVGPDEPAGGRSIAQTGAERAGTGGPRRLASLETCTGAPTRPVTKRVWTSLLAVPSKWPGC
jgi:hypothetical protein